MRSVQLATEGSFLCEVSGEAPLFQTAKKQNFLTVVGKQQAEPAIIMFFVEYHAIMGFCPSNIFWIENENKNFILRDLNKATETFSKVYS